MANWLDEVKRRGTAAWQGLRGSAPAVPEPKPRVNYADFQAQRAAAAAPAAAPKPTLPRAERFGRAAARAVRSTGPALRAARGVAINPLTVGAGVVSGFGDYKIQPEPDETIGGKLSRQAVETGLDVLSGGAKTIDFVAGMAGMDTDLSGGLRRRVQSDLGTYLLPREGQDAAPRSAPVQPEVAPATRPQPGDQLPATRPQPGAAQAPIDAAGLIRGTAVPAEGTGAFQRSGGQPVAVRSAPVQPEVVRPAAQDLGVFGNMVRAGTLAAGKRFEAEQQNKQTDQLIRAAQVRTARAGAERATRESNRSLIKERIQAIAEGAEPTVKSGVFGESAVDPKQREQAVSKRAADLRRDLEFTAADIKWDDGRRRQLDDLDQTQFNQVSLAVELRDRLKNAREGVLKSIRDYIGAKRFDSRNVVRYLPVAKTKDGRLILGSGETVSAGDYAGGGFNLLSPNDPVDAEVLDIIDNLPVRE